MNIAFETDLQVESLDRFVAAGAHRGAVYGLEWGDPEVAPHLARVKNEFLLPALNPAASVVEIGCGGGRWSRYFCGRVRRAFLVDATPSAEPAVRAHADWNGFEFIVAKDANLPTIPTAAADYAFSFDTFVHFHRELFDAYIREISRVLKPGGLLHLHHAARWPEAEMNERTFQYQGEEEIEALLSSVHLRLSRRHVEFRGGWGSILREAVRLLP